MKNLNEDPRYREEFEKLQRHKAKLAEIERDIRAAQDSWQLASTTNAAAQAIVEGREFNFSSLEDINTLKRGKQTYQAVVEMQTQRVHDAKIEASKRAVRERRGEYEALVKQAYVDARKLLKATEKCGEWIDVMTAGGFMLCGLQRVIPLITQDLLVRFVETVKDDAGVDLNKEK